MPYAKRWKFCTEMEALSSQSIVIYNDIANVYLSRLIKSSTRIHWSQKTLKPMKGSIELIYFQCYISELLMTLLAVFIYFRYGNQFLFIAVCYLTLTYNLC